MSSISIKVLSIMAMLLSVQMVPAPMVLAPVAAALAPVGAAITGATAGEVGAVAGVVGAATSAGSLIGDNARGKREVRRASHTSRIRRQAYKTLGLGLGTAPEDCAKQLTGAHLFFHEPAPNNVLVTGIPPACMTMLTIMTGKVDSGNPVPMGVDSAQFENLSDGDMQELKDALDARKAADEQKAAQV